MLGLGTGQGARSAPRVATRMVEVNEQFATIDGRRVSTSSLPEALRGDVRAAVIHSLAAEAAELGLAVPAVVVDDGGRTHLVVRPDGTVSEGSGGRPVGVAAAGVVLAVLAAWAGWSALDAVGGGDSSSAARKSIALTAPAEASSQPAEVVETPAPAPVTAPPQPRRVLAEAASVKTGEVRFVVRATQLPVSAVVKLSRPGQPVATRSVLLHKSMTKVWVPASAGERYSWAVRVTGVAPIRGKVRVLAAPTPPAPAAPDPVTPDIPSIPDPPDVPPPSSSGSDSDPPTSNDDSGVGDSGGGSPPPPPAQPDGGPPRGPIRG